MSRTPTRLQNWARHRDRKAEEVPWVRPSEIKHLPLEGSVVLVNGAFDLLHVGHMRLIFAAREHGATVVVALDTDEKISRTKGPSRPIQSFAQRAAALNYMPVDFIVPINTLKDMDILVRGLRPTLRVQSEEYLGLPSRYPEIPKLFVRRSAASTTSVIERILRKERLNAKTKTSKS